jgi:hypothetical protein
MFGLVVEGQVPHPVTKNVTGAEQPGELGPRGTQGPSTSLGMTGFETRAGVPALQVDLGGSGPTRAADAGRGAGALDALLGWELLRCEVQEQSAAFAGAGE